MVVTRKCKGRRSHCAWARGGAGALILGLVAGAASAQQTDFAVGFSQTVEYDSNILRLADGQSLGPDDESKEDLVYSPTVRANASLGLGRQNLYANASLGYRFHTENDRFNRERIAAGAGVNWAIGSRCDGTFGGDYSRQLSAIEDVQGTIDNTVERYGATWSGGCLVANRIRPSLGVSYAQVDNSEAGQARADRGDFTYTAGIAYLVSPRLNVGVNATYAERSFPTDAVGAAGAQGDETSKQTDVQAGISYDTGGRTSLQAGAGYSQVDNERGGDFEGFSGRLSAVIGVSSKLSVDISASRDVSGVDDLAASSVEQTSAALGVNWAVTSRIGATASVSYREREYVDRDVIAALGSRDDRTFIIGGGLGYSLDWPITLSLSVDYQDRDADRPQDEFSATAARLTMDVDF